MFTVEKYKLGNFVDVSKIKEISNDKYSTYTIPLKYRYRPDLIAWFLYKDISMQNLLSILNDIDNSPEGYYSGREIKIIKQEYKDLL